jgi:hypothetical protein
MIAAGEGILEKDIERRKRKVEVPTEKLPTLSAKFSTSILWWFQYIQKVKD